MWYGWTGNVLRLDLNEPLVTVETLDRLGLIAQAENERIQEAAQASIEQALDVCTAMEGGKRVIPAALWPPAESAAQDIRCDENLYTSPDAPRFVEREDFGDFTPLRFGDAISGTTLRNMERDERVIVLGEEVSKRFMIVPVIIINLDAPVTAAFFSIVSHGSVNIISTGYG